MSHFRHYKYFAILTGVGILCLLFLAEFSFSYFQLFFPFICVLAICTIIHAAIWSVFGTGSYFYRLSMSLLFVLPVLVGSVLGMAYLTRSQPPSDLIFIICATPLVCFAMLMAAQFPLWIMRIGFGWQLIRDGEQPELLALKQLFAITFVCALALAIPRPVLTNLIMSSNELTVGSTQYFPETGPDGIIEMNQVLVTEENLNATRILKLKESREQADSMLILSSIYLAAIGALTLPLVWFSFRFQRVWVIGWSAGYCFGLFVLVSGVWVAFIDFDFYVWEMALPTFGYFALYASMICVPLSISRSKGFTLVTGKRTADENQPGALSSDEPNGT